MSTNDSQEERAGDVVNWRWVVYGLIGLLFFDVASLALYTFKALEWPLLAASAGLIVWIIAKDIRWMLYLPMLELAWTSFGYGLAWELGDTRLSLRMLIFTIVLAGWVYGAVIQKSVHRLRLRSAAFKLFVAMVIVAAWGAVRAMIEGRGVSAIFYDGNAYAFVLYFPVWLSVFTWKQVKPVFSLLTAAALGLSIKSLAVFYIFVHGFDVFNLGYVYLWIRDTRVGEITYAGGMLWRVFMQSQIYIGIVVLFIYSVMMRARESRTLLAYGGLLSLLFAGVIVSMSRSYWIGLAVTFALLVLLGPRLIRVSQRAGMRAFAYGIGAFAVSLLCVAALVSLPPGGGDFGALRDRISRIQEPAGISRLALLGPLLREATSDIVLGKGFGATVVYYSSDPRIKTALNPTGITETYAFEWGYLDQLLKFGAIGFAVLIAVYLAILQKGYALARSYPQHAPAAVAALAGFFYMLTVHMFSPYLNHPLGIGYLMLVILIAFYPLQQHETTVH